MSTSEALPIDDLERHRAAADLVWRRSSTAERHFEVNSAVGSLRAEGLELDAAGKALMHEMAEGHLTPEQVRARVLAPYRG